MQENIEPEKSDKQSVNMNQNRSDEDQAHNKQQVIRIGSRNEIDPEESYQNDFEDNEQIEDNE